MKLKTVKGEKMEWDKKGERYKPTFSITAQDLPALKEWNVGQEYSLTMVVKMVSASARGANHETHATFEVEKIAPVEVKVKDMTDAQFTSHSAKVRGGKS